MNTTTPLPLSNMDGELFLSNGKYRKLTASEQQRRLESNIQAGTSSPRSSPIRQDKIPSLELPATSNEQSQRRTTWYAGQKEDNKASLNTSAESELKRNSDGLAALRIPDQYSLHDNSKLAFTHRSAPQLANSEAASGASNSGLERRQNSDPAVNINSPVVRLRKKKETQSNQRRNKAISTYDSSDSPNTSRRSRPVSAFFTSGIMKKPQSNMITNEPLTLRGTLENKKMRSAFLSFLDSEYSAENLKFWCSCEKFKKLKTSEQRSREGENIYEQFISSRSPHQVNIDHMTQRQITLIMMGGDAMPGNVFEAAQRKIFSIMENDSYPRFLRSGYYKEVASRKSPLESFLVTLLPGSKSTGNSQRTKDGAQIHNSSNNNNCNCLNGGEDDSKASKARRSASDNSASCARESLLSRYRVDPQAIAQGLCDPKSRLNSF